MMRTKRKVAGGGSSVDRIYSKLKRMAMTYAFRPGEQLNEVELAASLGVSRTPLREVLNRLVAEGLLDFVPHRGFSCRPLEAKTIYDLYEIRCGLEMVSAKLATQRASDEELAELIDFWERVSLERENYTPLQVVECDESFHERIAILSQNVELLKTLQNINSRIYFVRQIFMEDGQRRNATCDEHKAVLVAMSQRDAEAAAICMSTHITLRREHLVNVIKEGLARLYMDEWGQSV